MEILVITSLICKLKKLKFYNQPVLNELLRLWMGQSMFSITFYHVMLSKEN